MTSQMFQILVTLQHLNLYLFKFSTLQHPGVGIKTTVWGMHSGLAVLTGCSESSSSKPVDRIRVDFSVVEIVPVHRRSPKEVFILRFATMMYVEMSVTMWCMSLFMPTPLPSVWHTGITPLKVHRLSVWAAHVKSVRKKQKVVWTLLEPDPPAWHWIQCHKSLVYTSCLLGEHWKGIKHRRRGGSSSENQL